MPDSSEQTKDLVRRLESAMNSRELDLLDDVVAPDFVRHCEATPDFDVRSREQFKEFLRQNTAAFPDNTQTFTQIVAEGAGRASGRRTRAPRRGSWARSRPRGTRCGSTSAAFCASRTARSPSCG